MPQSLFLNKTIAIEATPDKVWRVLTQQNFTEQWVDQFGLPGGRIISSWLAGESVLWVDNNGTVRVGGQVTEAEPESRLHFTVVDQANPQPTTMRDGITYHLISTEDGTELTVEQGDFAKIANGQKYLAATEETWDRVLPIIKDLAEKL